MTLDKIYTDITTQVIPKIAEWVAITKDYAFDLFGRYIKYLIITDSIMLWLNILIVTISIIILFKLSKYFYSNRGEYNDSRKMDITWGYIYWMLIFLPTFWICWYNIISYWQDLIKDLTVPEVRIYEIYNLNK